MIYKPATLFEMRCASLYTSMEMGYHIIHVDDIKGVNISRKSNKDRKYKDKGKTEKQ